MILLFSLFIFRAVASDCQAVFDRFPSHVRAITNKLPQCSGPNCHNAVTYWHNIISTFREVKSNEIDSYLSNKKMFRKLKRNEEPELGDVVVFRLGPKDPILHSAIFISQRDLWQKEGDWKEAPWIVTPLADVYKAYDELVVEVYRKAL